MLIRQLGTQPYVSVWEDMKHFTMTRKPDTMDELWLLEHPAVYTQGQAGKAEHILNPQLIPVIRTDRGGQVTYHGPGQLIAYVLMDIQRRQLGIRTMVCHLENVLIDMLRAYGINAERQQGAPGVYVNERKIASIGLRVKNGCTYHGIALNVNLDLSPFRGINPCGYASLEMTQIKDFIPEICTEDANHQFVQHFLRVFHADSESVIVSDPSQTNGAETITDATNSICCN
ncbi:MAG: lipoyl(octanoyl) transferase LipB [Legionellaceae bacterium]|nr:lipoyl(octanoyl) transferase LipB [Legionellaceae bacterium]